MTDSCCHNEGDHHCSTSHNAERYKIHKIASRLGINNGMIDLCNASLNDIIAMALNRAHVNPSLWLYLMLTHQSINAGDAVNKLMRTGHSSAISHLIQLVNASHSSSTGQNFADNLEKTSQKMQQRAQIAQA